MKIKYTLGAAFACMFLLSSTAYASDTMTIRWTNWLPTTVYLNNWSCLPSGACTFPSQISSGQTATLTVKPSDPSATVRQLILEYGYFKNFVENTCQIHVDVSKDSSGLCKPGTPYMTKTKGNPYCEVTLNSRNDLTCDYSYTARIQ